MRESAVKVEKAEEVIFILTLGSNLESGQPLSSGPKIPPRSTFLEVAYWTLRRGLCRHEPPNHAASTDVPAGLAKTTLYLGSGS